MDFGSYRDICRCGNRLSFVREACRCVFFFFFQAEDGIRDLTVTGVQTCALPICFATEAFCGRGAQQAGEAHERFMREVITPAIRPQALELLRTHQQAGDQIIIVTATNEFVTRPIAAALGVQELIAVELERDAQGWFTGEIRGTPSMRSTRLNSSHSQISYAVFCLKKKKKYKSKQQATTRQP